MNLKLIFAGAALAALALASCSSDKGRDISELKNASQADSLAYYYGLLYANDYWNAAQADTTLKTEENRRLYLEGFKKGLELARENEAYNQGVLSGIQVAMESANFQNDFDVALSPEMIRTGLAYALDSQVKAEPSKAQEYLNLTLQTLGMEKQRKDSEAARKALVSESKKLGMQKIDDDLYSKVLSAGSGQALTNEDDVDLDISVSTLDGKPVNFPAPKSINMASVPADNVMGKAIRQLKDGESAQFLTSAPMLLGARASRMHLKGSDLLLINISVKRAEKSATPAPQQPEGSAPQIVPVQ